MVALCSTLINMWANSNTIIQLRWQERFDIFCLLHWFTLWIDWKYPHFACITVLLHTGRKMCRSLQQVVSIDHCCNHIVCSDSTWEPDDLLESETILSCDITIFNKSKVAILETHVGLTSFLKIMCTTGLHCIFQSKRRIISTGNLVQNIM